jgi:tRNA A-37 threonylcarbamoyl transferase component Bud32
MICQHCGKQHKNTARFCPTTGKLIASTVSPPVQPDSSAGLTGRLQPNFCLNNRYMVQVKVGQGGMAAVYRALDTRTNAVYAIKEMSDSFSGSLQDHQMALTNFQREANLLSRLRHSNLPVVTDFFRENNKHYLVMEYIDGVTLGDLLSKQSHAFDEPTVIRWAIQLCDVLTYLHYQNPPVVFRDLKPDNIMLSKSGQLKLIDFGIARFFKVGNSRDTQALGTIGFAAPEALNGQTDSRSDIYSLCVALYQLLTGFDPCDCPYSLPPIRQINPGISKELEQIIQRGLNLSPEQRFQSAIDMRSQLVSLQGQHKPASPHPIKIPAGGPIKSHRPTTRLIMAALKLSTGQIIGFLGGGVALLILAAWLLTPALRSVPIDWNIFPIFALFGPMAFAAYPRRLVAFVAHAILTTTLIVTISIRLGIWFTTENTILATIASGVFLEVWLALLPSIKGKSGPDAWKREISWYALMGAPLAFIYLSSISSGVIGNNPLTWLFGGVFAGAAWFLGDLINQYLLYRQTGYRRFTTP